jgi:hypothetical protein
LIEFSAPLSIGFFAPQTIAFLALLSSIALMIADGIVYGGGGGRRMGWWWRWWGRWMGKKEAGEG